EDRDVQEDRRRLAVHRVAYPERDEVVAGLVGRERGRRRGGIRQSHAAAGGDGQAPFGNQRRGRQAVEAVRVDRSKRNGRAHRSARQRLRSRSPAGDRDAVDGGREVTAIIDHDADGRRLRRAPGVVGGDDAQFVGALLVAGEGRVLAPRVREARGGPGRYG